MGSSTASLKKFLLSFEQSLYIASFQKLNQPRRIAARVDIAIANDCARKLETLRAQLSESIDSDESATSLGGEYGGDMLQRLSKRFTATVGK